MISIQLTITTLLFAGVLPAFVEGQAAAATAYTPSFGQCPSGFSLVRQAGSSTNQSLSSSESSYLQGRKSDVLPDAWKTYLKNAANPMGSAVPLPDYVTNILSGNASTTPNLGIATSGGGYRAAIFGAGILNALDGRNSTSVSAGLGGLLQSATYLSGLSGGSWLVTSLVQANFPTIQELIFGGSGDYAGWLAQFDIFAPSNDTATNGEFIATLLEESLGKAKVGLPITVTDLWARALARHFVNGTNAASFFDNSSTHGAGITFSGLTNLSTITSHSIPFPIIVTNSVSSNENVSTIITAEEDAVPLTNPIYEINMYEMGSYDPILSAFTPTQYLGTVNTSSCITGFDQVAFIAGTSSELFNEFNTSEAALSNSTIGPVIQFLNQTFPQPSVELDVTRYPNPFFGLNNGTYIDSAHQVLSMVDGGEDGEVIPIQPLLVKAREVDVIIAIDGSGNASSWADGSSIIASQNRTTLFPSSYDFPPVPSTPALFISEGLTTRPTFFGCNTSTDAPLVIYLANGGPPRNSPVAPLTNASTFQTAYEDVQIQGMLDQIWGIATQGAPTSSSGAADPMWPACLACAVVDRARNRTGTARSGVCASCFETYCWSNTSSSTSGAGRASVGVNAVVGMVLATVGALTLL